MSTSRGFRARACLSLVRIEVNSPVLDRLHKAIEDEIAESYRLLAETELTDDSDGLDALIDDECDQTEELLGMAFVAGQSFMTRIRTGIARLNNVCIEDLKSGLSF